MISNIGHLAQMVLFSNFSWPGLSNVLNGMKAASIFQSSNPILARLAAKRKRINDVVSLILLFQAWR